MIVIYSPHIKFFIVILDEQFVKLTGILSIKNNKRFQSDLNDIS